MQKLREELKKNLSDIERCPPPVHKDFRLYRYSLKGIINDLFVGLILILIIFASIRFVHFIISIISK